MHPPSELRGSALSTRRPNRIGQLARVNELADSLASSFANCSTDFRLLFPFIAARLAAVLCYARPPSSVAIDPSAFYRPAGVPRSSLLVTKRPLLPTVTQLGTLACQVGKRRVTPKIPGHTY